MYRSAKCCMTTLVFLAILNNRYVGVVTFVKLRIGHARFG